MTRIFKYIVTLFAALIVQFFLTTLLFIVTDLPYLVDILLALPGAVFAAKSIWRSASGETIGMGFSVVAGSLIVGAVGFVIGFLGPMLMIIETTQGPLLGVLITGPIGLVLGALAGFLFARKNRQQRDDAAPPGE